MTACTARLNNGPLTCTRLDDHPTGHVYVSTSVDDGKHDDNTENQ